jgi:Ca2+-binding EF-hand superfamily protein
MSKRKLAIAAGALVVIGGAAAIAAVGHREGRMGHRGMMHEMGDQAQGYGHGHGMGHGMGEGRGGGRGMMRGQMGEDGEQGMGRGWRRSMSADDFDARTRERFARFDKNSDGVIDATEVEAALVTAGERGRQFGDRMRQRFQSRFDADRDGKVTRQEAMDRVRREFQRMDLDRDGRITDADLPPMMRGRDVLKGGAGGMGMRGGMGGMMMGRLIEADANKDGIITLDEAVAAAGRRFDQADRNKDGTIDAADHDAMRKEMTDYRVRRFLHAHGAGPDGKVTREQFFKHAKERFAEFDTNNDGRLDRQDRMGGPGMMGRGQGQGMGQGQGAGAVPGAGPGRGQGGPGMQERMQDRGPPR